MTGTINLTGSGFRNSPRVLRGAFVEYGLTLPLLTVPFQFNPVQLTRGRSLKYLGKDTKRWEKLHKDCVNLNEIRDKQVVEVQEETISFEIRLDATDGMDEGDVFAAQYGIAPQLATLELMLQPKGQRLFGIDLLEKIKGHSLTKKENPPLILFIWGRHRVLPVNINSMNITETEFSADLNPIRATVSVNLTVIEGKNPPWLYSKAIKDGMSALDLSCINMTEVVIPG